MKLTIHKNPQQEETEIIIHCSQVTPELEDIIARINLCGQTLKGTWEESTYSIPIDKIYYLDSVDDKTFFYTQKQAFECRKRLYELETELKNFGFVRISKNTIVNIRAVVSVRPVEVSRMEILLKNKEKLIVTRNYRNEFKKAF